MGLLTNLFGRQDATDTPLLHDAVEHAVAAVEPLLMQGSDYPERYHRPVSSALAYARQLADSLPGPVCIDRDAYGRDAFVHVLFPDVNAIADAISSSLSMQEYLRDPPAGGEFYALMGMRRIDRNLLGMELLGSNVQREVAQQATYFISHTLEAPSPAEALAREKIATRFFYSLVGKVKERIEQRRHNKETLLQERKELLSGLYTAGDGERAALEARLDMLAEGLQAVIESLEVDRYAADFEAVLLHPEEHLHLRQTSITLDNMGIRRSADDSERGREFTLSELVGYDRRDWTVTLVRCSNLQYESFAARLDKAYRYLKL